VKVYFARVGPIYIKFTNSLFSPLKSIIRKLLFITHRSEPSYRITK